MKNQQLRLNLGTGSAPQQQRVGVSVFHSSDRGALEGTMPAHFALPVLRVRKYETRRRLKETEMLFNIFGEIVSRGGSEVEHK